MRSSSRNRSIFLSRVSGSTPTPPTPMLLGWDESAAWDEMAAFYRRGEAN